MQQRESRRPNLNLQYHDFGLRRRKQEVKKQMPTSSTMMESNQSGVSIEEFHNIPQPKREESRGNPEEFLTLKKGWNNERSNQTPKKTNIHPFGSFKVIPTAVYSQRRIQMKDINPSNSRASVNKRKYSVSCESKDRSSAPLSRATDPRSQIQKIRQQRCRKSKQLQQLQSRISLLGKTIRRKQSSSLRQQNSELRKRLVQYSKVVSQFSQFVENPKRESPQLCEMREKWQSIVRGINQSGSEY